MTTPLDAIDRIKAKVQTRIAAFHEARIAADAWARVARCRTFVVENDSRYFLADSADLRAYHRRDIHQRRAHIVYIGRPMPPAFGAPIDVEFVMEGWQG